MPTCNTQAQCELVAGTTDAGCVQKYIYDPTLKVQWDASCGEPKCATTADPNTGAVTASCGLAQPESPDSGCALKYASTPALAAAAVAAPCFTTQCKADESGCELAAPDDGLDDGICVTKYSTAGSAEKALWDATPCKEPKCDATTGACGLQDQDPTAPNAGCEIRFSASPKLSPYDTAAAAPCWTPQCIDNDCTLAAPVTGMLNTICEGLYRCAGGSAAGPVGGAGGQWGQGSPEGGRLPRAGTPSQLHRARTPPTHPTNQPTNQPTIVPLLCVPSRSDSVNHGDLYNAWQNAPCKDPKCQELDGTCALELPATLPDARCVARSTAKQPPYNVVGYLKECEEPKCEATGACGKGIVAGPVGESPGTLCRAVAQDCNEAGTAKVDLTVEGTIGYTCPCDVPECECLSKGRLGVHSGSGGGCAGGASARAPGGTCRAALRGPPRAPPASFHARRRLRWRPPRLPCRRQGSRIRLLP